MASFVPDTNPSPAAPREDASSRPAITATLPGRRAAHAQQSGVNRITAGLAAQREALAQARSARNPASVLPSRAASVGSVSSAPATSEPLNPAEELTRKRRIAEAELNAYKVYVPPKGLRLNVDKGTDPLRYWDVSVLLNWCAHQVCADVHCRLRRTCSCSRFALQWTS
jgi:hypothetical protein